MEKTMRFLTGCLFLFVAANLPAAAATAPPTEGGRLPDITLEMPADSVHRNYLGLQGEGSFTIPDIDAEVVIVEIFSMYCPHCQREAPTINQIYEKIEADPKLKNKVKIIGIGVGNSAYEVKHFRQAYDIPFPLFADGDFNIHKQMGEVRTPYFLGVRILGEGNHKIFYSRLGGPQDAGVMLEELIAQSGLAR
jgi:peroxiredoxin